MTEMKTRNDGGGNKERTFTVAVVLLVGFGLFLIYMVWRASKESEVHWARLVFLFGAAEAITFAAVGWLFGSEVHRKRAENAEARGDAAALTAEEARSAEARADERGAALATAIRSQTSVRDAAHLDSAEQLAGPAGRHDPESVTLDALRRMADELFPPTAR